MENKNINNINKELWQICKDYNIKWPVPEEKEKKEIAKPNILPSEKGIVKKEKKEISKPIIFPAEGNLNRLGIFALSTPRIKCDITRIRDVKSTGESCLVEIRHPSYYQLGNRMLGAPELRVWLIFQYLYAQQMRNNKERFIENGKKIPFTYVQICKLLKIFPDGESLKRVRSIIENLEDTKIIITEFYNKGKDKLEMTERFNIFSHSWNVRKKYDRKDKRDFHCIRIDTQLMENLDNGYFTTFNLSKLMSIKKSIALGLYLKLTSAFYGSPVLPLYFTYKNLCFYCQIPVYKSNYYINKQFNPALDELIEIKFLLKYKWEDEGKKHVGIKFWPGDLYWADREKRITHC